MSASARCSAPIAPEPVVERFQREPKHRSGSGREYPTPKPRGGGAVPRDLNEIRPHEAIGSSPRWPCAAEPNPWLRPDVSKIGTPSRRAETPTSFRIDRRVNLRESCLQAVDQLVEGPHASVHVRRRPAPKLLKYDATAITVETNVTAHGPILCSPAKLDIPFDRPPVLPFDSHPQGDGAVECLDPDSERRARKLGRCGPGHHNLWPKADGVRDLSKTRVDMIQGFQEPNYGQAALIHHFTPTSSLALHHRSPSLGLRNLSRWDAAPGRTRCPRGRP